MKRMTTSVYAHVNGVGQSGITISPLNEEIWLFEIDMMSEGDVTIFIPSEEIDLFVEKLLEACGQEIKEKERVMS